MHENDAIGRRGPASLRWFFLFSLVALVFTYAGATGDREVIHKLLPYVGALLLILARGGAPPAATLIRRGRL
jgi:hypothetical protein